MVSVYNILKHVHRDECDGRVEVAREGRELDEANTRIKLLEAKLSELEARLPRANSFPETKVKGFFGHTNICHLIISSSGHIAIGSGSW